MFEAWVFVLNESWQEGRESKKTKGIGVVCFFFLGSSLHGFAFLVIFFGFTKRPFSFFWGGFLSKSKCRLVATVR